MFVCFCLGMYVIFSLKVASFNGKISAWKRYNYAHAFVGISAIFFHSNLFIFCVCVSFFPFNHFMEYHITDMFSYICGISNTWYRKCKCKGIFSHLYYEYYTLFFHPQRNSIKLCENNHRFEIVFMNYSSEFISRQSIDCPKIAQYNFHVTCS